MLRIGLAQCNVTVGDFKANAETAIGMLEEAASRDVDIVVFPELVTTSYPAEDLLFRENFVKQNNAALKRIVKATQSLVALVGFVDSDAQGLLNAAAVVSRGQVVGTYHKRFLPNYGVFDEKRYFLSGISDRLLALRRHKEVVVAGISICEDIWQDDRPFEGQPSIVMNLSASPFHAGKRNQREQLLQHRAKDYGSWIVYTNLVGGQDELVFDGGSLIVNPQGEIVFRAPQFEEGLFVYDVPLKHQDVSPYCRDSLLGSIALPTKRKKTLKKKKQVVLDTDIETFEALSLGLRDYVAKNGFEHVVLGLSGGIDSALVAAIAVHALGKDAVTCVSMPSRYSSEGTQSDAKKIAKALGVEFMELPIEGAVEAFEATLAPIFEGTKTGLAEENLQARIRGNLLMALSNKFGWLVLATGNKAELSTGYCTLYGDMAGGFAVIKDLPKAQVRKLSKTANRLFGKTVIPQSVIRRAPSAELRPNQKDQDSLPPYEQLDKIVKAYVEERQSLDAVEKQVYLSRKEIQQILAQIDGNEYKRRQAPVGTKITPLAFGRDRRMPMTNRFKEQ